MDCKVCVICTTEKSFDYFDNNYRECTKLNNNKKEV